MELDQILRHVNAGTAQAFVKAARHMIDALMIEGARVRQTQTPGVRDYNTTDALSREAPAGGWLSDEELRGATQRMAESIAAEKWTEGAAAAIRALSLMGAL